MIPPTTPSVPSVVQWRRALTHLTVSTVLYGRFNDAARVRMPTGQIEKARPTVEIIREWRAGCVQCGKPAPHPKARDICAHCQRWTCGPKCSEKHAAEMHAAGR